MVKQCPECGEQLPENAKFCMNCGYNFDIDKSVKTDIFSNGKIFIILIAAVLIIGSLAILSMGMGGFDSSDNKDEFDITITGVGGWVNNASNKQSYELYTQALFTKVPSDKKGYIVKTSPAIGRTVKKGTEITLYESKGPEKYEIEDYTGKNYIEVKTILENNYGLNVVIEKMEVDDNKEYDENVIISQDLKVGTEVSKGANITLYIPDIVVKYPDFTDGTWTKSDIESFCKKYGIEVEFKYDAKPGYDEGAIISQSRPKDMPVVKGVSIEIHVATKYTAPETNTEENNDDNN